MPKIVNAALKAKAIKFVVEAKNCPRGLHHDSPDPHLNVNANRRLTAVADFIG